MHKVSVNGCVLFDIWARAPNQTLFLCLLNSHTHTHNSPSLPHDWSQTCEDVPPSSSWQAFFGSTPPRTTCWASQSKMIDTYSSPPPWTHKSPRPSNQRFEFGEMFRRVIKICTTGRVSLLLFICDYCPNKISLTFRGCCVVWQYTDNN